MKGNINKNSGDKNPPPTAADVICYHTDFSAFIYDQNEIQSINYVQESKCKSNSPIDTPENVVDSVHKEDRDDFVSLVRATVLKGESNTAYCRLKSNEGEWRLFDLTFRPSEDYPNIDAAVLTGNDISSQYYFEQRRRVINRVLRHDLRNDMNVVKGNANIIMELGSDEVAEYAEKIHSVAEDMVTLGKEVREIDLELNRVNRKIRCIEIRNMLLNQIKRTHKEHPDITFKTDIHDVTVVGNTLVESAIQHLIENAVEHSGVENKELSITVTTDIDTGTTDDEDIISVNIIDNGCGIPQGEKEVIESGIETPLDHISGLGLWMVKWVMESVDGKFTIKHREEVGGTTATLKFISADNISTNQAQDMVDNTHDNMKSQLMKIARSDETMKTTTRTD